MNFYALAYKYQEDIFFNIAADEDTSSLDEQCFLPSKEMAEQFIEDALSTDYVPVEIKLESLSPTGVWSYIRGPVKEWDEE